MIRSLLKNYELIKNELIKSDFPEAFLSENKPGFFGKSLFTQQKIAVTIKQMGVSYRKVLILANKVGVVEWQQPDRVWITSH